MARYTMVWILALTALGAVAVEEPLNIGSRHELFVDYTVLDRASMTNVELRLQEPRPAEVCVAKDKPWYGKHNFGVAVWQDGDRYLMQFRGLPGEEGHGCRVVSKDGIHWTTPILGLVEFKGSKANNAVPKIPTGHAKKESGVAPFVDTRPGVPAAERYKGIYVVAQGSSEMGVAVSSNGLNWTQFASGTVFRCKQRPAFDTYNHAFWSERDQAYVMLYRQRFGRKGFRSIGWAKSTNFVDWTDAMLSVFDNNGENPSQNLYTPATSPYFRAPHIYVAFPARLMEKRAAIAAEEAGLPGRQDVSDTFFMTSRRYGQYDRTFKESFIRPGLGATNWTTRSNYALQGVLQTGPAEMSIYVNRHYAHDSWFIQRCVLRLDGFASLHAGYEPGEALTRPILFSGGKLEINYATSAYGQVQVELQDAGGKPIPGFALADCKPIIGDEIKRHVAWKNTDVSALAGKPVRLRFVLRDADVFSFKFEE